MISSPALSIVVPVRNGASTLTRILSAILASDLRREEYELIVVDDASSDGSAEVAARYADTVVRLAGRKSGSAYARNRGAELARGGFLAFVDHDALVQADTLKRMLRQLFDHPGIDAVSASHAQRSDAGNLVSQYRSLLLHYGDQRNDGTSGNVGSPCTVIRRDAFLAAGMYDEWRFDSAPVEGLEFGHRLQSSGRDVRSTKDLEITVIGRLTLRSICSEVWRRSALVARSLGYQRTRKAVPGDIVFTLSRSAAPAFVVLCIIAFSGAFLPPPDASTMVALVLAGVVALSLRDYLYFARARGIHFLLAIAPLHFLLQATNGLGLCAGWILRDAIGDGAPDATTQAYAEVGVETWPPVRRTTSS